MSSFVPDIYVELRGATNVDGSMDNSGEGAAPHYSLTDMRSKWKSYVTNDVMGR